MKRSLESDNSTDTNNNNNNGHDVSKIANRKDTSNILHPTNPLVGPLLTDMYQISMTYAHWKSNRYNDDAVFDLFFRTNPFRGEYCIFAGSDEVLRFVSSFKFSESDVDYLRELLGESCDPKFFDWLLTLDCSKVRVYMMQEGSVVFPREPLIRIEGPLVIGQLLETTLLNLINFPSLIATCAARMRIAAGKNKTLLEFGLRRAQGPDGGLSASKYAYIGGFNGTSNVLSGKLFGLKVSGTIAHAYVMAHVDIESLHTRKIMNKLTGIEIDFVDLVLEIRTFFGFTTTNIGELAAFIEYAQAFPHGFLALVDTYDTLQSGVPNFIAVAVALYEIGYVPKGIRLDSGDLAYLSKETRKMFHQYEELYNNSTRKATIAAGSVTVQLSHLTIVASNDINEKVIRSLNEEKHEIDTFGIGTHLVTCFDQPALGCVYKLVEINRIPRIKLSQNVEKLVIPGSKSVYRLYGKDGRAILDRMQFSHEPLPLPHVSILCRDPFREDKRAYVTPLKVVPLLNLIWNHGEILINNGNNNSDSSNADTNSSSGTLITQSSSSSSSQSSSFIPSLDASRSHCEAEINSLREDHVRGLNPTPYKVSVSQALYDFLHQLWSQEAPIAILS